MSFRIDCSLLAVIVFDNSNIVVCDRSLNLFFNLNVFSLDYIILSTRKVSIRFIVVHKITYFLVYSLIIFCFYQAYIVLRSCIMFVMYKSLL